MRMQILSDGNGERRIALALDAGDEVIEDLQRLALEEDIAGAHFTGIGGLSEATLAFFDLDATAYRDNHLPEQLELASLTGTLALRSDDDDPHVHAHAVVGRADGTAFAGHLRRAIVRPTVEIVLVESPHPLVRVPDPATGLSLLADR